MKEKYLSLMEKALSAYSHNHIIGYLDAVKREGLKEHGFPRLIANIGILISHGKHTDLLPIFLEMMDVCCEEIPKVKAANDFSVREIIFCIIEVEQSGIIPRERIEIWKNSLARIVPEKCYDKFATSIPDKVNNWACFTALSEYMRQYIGLCDSSEFIDLQLENQLKYMDENGMYREPHCPMVYDLVPRILFSILLHFGYRGEHYKYIDAVLEKSGLMTLCMQSVSGEIPFGGRSAQFVFNEALLAIIYEFEAIRYSKRGDIINASRFKEGTVKALSNIELWLSSEKIRHVKNCYPLESGYGCEKYAYFDKYMITVASYLYCAYSICDDSIETCEISVQKPYTFSTSEPFHKHFMYAGGYFLEFDTRADKNYDASGLGRIHKTDAPSPICLSLPCTATPKYKNNADDANDLSLCVGTCVENELRFATGEDSKYEVLSLSSDNISSYAEILTCVGGKNIQSFYSVNENGVEIKVIGEGKIAYMLPAFFFDGEKYSDIFYSSKMLRVSYLGYSCEYTSNCQICDLKKNAYNRNGQYRIFCAEGENEMNIKLRIQKDNR